MRAATVYVYMASRYKCRVVFLRGCVSRVYVLTTMLAHAMALGSLRVGVVEAIVNGGTPFSGWVKNLQWWPMQGCLG
jgi:hypothetical protein